MGVNGKKDWVMPVQTGNQGFVKDLNKAIVLNTIWNEPDICRADISRLSGLNRATVSSLVEELIADGHVVEREWENQHVAETCDASGQCQCVCDGRWIWA